MHPGENLSEDKNLTVPGEGQAGLIYIGGAPEVAVLNSSEDRMGDLFGIEDAARALLSVAAVMIDPCLSENAPTEAAIRTIPVVAGEGWAGLQREGVGGGAESHDRPAGLDVIHDVLHLAIGQVAKAGEDDEEIGGVQRLQAGDVVETIRIDRAVLGIDGEKDRAAEAVTHREDFAELRQQFLGAVLFVPADEDDVFI